MLIPKQCLGSTRYRNLSAEHSVNVLSGLIAPAARAGRASIGLFGGRGLGFACGPAGCVCTGDADCNDMFSTSVCGPYAVCIDNVCWCSR
jgi:hypothetical protein